MTDNRQYAALEWVLDEINITLNQAKKALTSYFEDNNDTAQLRFCLTYIHQVYGTLHMLEFHRAAMLAEAAESLARALDDQKIVNREQAKEVLMRAILQLPNCLQQTQPDTPSAALSLINELRAARGASPLHNAVFFNPDLSYADKVVGKKLLIAEEDENFKSVTAKLRQMYRQANAGIVDQSNADENFRYLSKVCEHLQKITHGTYQFAVWQIAAALIEGLQQNVVSPTSVVSSVFDQLDRELERLSEDGIEVLDKRVDDSLLKNLLYCVAYAQGETPLICEIRENYGLDYTDLTDNTAQHSVSAAINPDVDKAQLSVMPVMRQSRNALEKVKDAVTGYIATQWDVENIELTPTLLRETCSELLTLPLERPAQILDACADYIGRQLIGAGITPKWQQLDHLADAIAGVDYYLERMIANVNDDSEFLLDLAEKSVASLGHPVVVLPKQKKAEQEKVEQEKVQDEKEISPSHVAPTIMDVKEPNQPLAPTAQDLATADDDLVDDEIIEIFIEEAKEVEENIAVFLPKWVMDLDDVDALKEVRRAFHTLKGSGRMVGASDIGELAWSIENMLNRVIEKTIPATEVITICLPNGPHGRAHR